jgi:hypothetical protein
MMTGAGPCIRKPGVIDVLEEYSSPERFELLALKDC